MWLACEVEIYTARVGRDQEFGEWAGREGGPGTFEVGVESGRDDGLWIGGAKRADEFMKPSYARDTCRDTHLSTTSNELHSTAASSFTSNGLLPVLSSCCNTATTISSSTPQKSIRPPSQEARGDGGGVCSYVGGGCCCCCWGPGRLCDLLAVEGVGGEGELCDRLTRFVGGWWWLWWCC